MVNRDQHSVKYRLISNLSRRMEERGTDLTIKICFDKIEGASSLIKRTRPRNCVSLHPFGDSAIGPQDQDR